MAMSEKNRGDFFAPFVRAVIAPLWAIKERSPYLRHLASLKGAPYRPFEEVRADQWRRFKALLSHAYVHTDYYRERMREAGLLPDDIALWQDLARLPILTKDDIRAHRDRMIARNIPPSRLMPKKTSGSTGVSLDFFVDEESLQWKRACALRHNRWTGWELGERVGALWGNPEYKKSWKGYVRNMLLERQTYLDTLQMDEQAMLDFYFRIKQKRPTLLFGHAHSLYLFARFLEARDRADLRPKGIISSAMVLHEFERAVIERAFDCKVTNRYGCEEVSLIASECSEHRGLHINMDTVIVEFVADGRAAGPGEAGALVVTDLTNRGMPFIRYKIGDVGIPSDRTCPCGCTYPLIESLEGRAADYVVTADGRYISGISLTENFAMLLGGVKQLQIVQEAVDRLIFRIVRGERFGDSDLKELDRLVAHRFGPAMGYSVEFVDSLQQERSGKYRFCISKVRNSFS